MITPETPLVDVVALLPTESARLMMNLDETTQTLVLTDLKQILCKWEQSGVHNDPITFAAAVAPVVEVLVIDNVTLVAFGRSGHGHQAPQP